MSVIAVTNPPAQKINVKNGAPVVVMPEKVDAYVHPSEKGTYAYVSVDKNPNGHVPVVVNPTGGTIPYRTPDGQIRAASPVNNDDVANKKYVDTAISTAPKVNPYIDPTGSGTYIYASVDKNPNRHIAAKVAPEASTIVYRSSTGGVRCAAPIDNFDAINLKYFKEQVGTIEDTLDAIISIQNGLIGGSV